MTRAFNQRRSISGFTLVELLVVVGIVTVLFGLLLSALTRARESARRIQCQNHLHQIGIALLNYHNTRSAFPPGLTGGESGEFPFLGWEARLLPYLDKENLWAEVVQGYQADLNFLHDPPHVAFTTFVPDFACPSDPRLGPGQKINGVPAGPTSYLGVEGLDQFQLNGVLFLDSQVRISDVVDGTSTTLLVGERPPSSDGQFGWWYAGWGQAKDGSADMVLGVSELKTTNFAADCSSGPYHFQAGSLASPCDTFHFWSPHSGGANFLFCDGSVHFLSYSVEPIMPFLASRNGGEVIPAFD